MNAQWDYRFLRLAKEVSSWSRDPSTKTGAVIVRPNKSVCSVGYNGFPQGMLDLKKHYDDRETKLSRIVHCEVNALLFAREPVENYYLYTYPFASCDRCVVQMLQAGIKWFCFPKCPESALVRWGKTLERSKQYINECGAVWIEHAGEV